MTGCSGTSDDRTGAPDTGDPPGAEHVVSARNAHLSSWAVDGDGAVLGVWARGWGQRAPEALAVRSRDGRELLSRSAAGVSTYVVAPLSSGWLVRTSGRDGSGIARVEGDASVHPLQASGTPVRPRAGDVAVGDRHRILVYRPADDRLHVVPQPRMRWQTGAYVTPEGALLATGWSGGAAIWARFDHGRWSRGRWATGVSGGVVGGSGDHIVVALGGPTADGVDATPVAGLAVSDDGGGSWRELDVPPGLDEALSVAVTTDGTAFVSTGSGPLLRVRPGRGATVVPSLRPSSVTALGNRVYALAAPGRHWVRERILVSRDLGRSWTAPR